MWISVPQIPDAITRIKTSPSSGTGTGNYQFNSGEKYFGIGLATACKFAQEGATVIVVIMIMSSGVD